MRPVIALVEARPDTILDDYRRLFDLASLGGAGPGGRVSLAVSRFDDCPGFRSPSWQVQGAMHSLGFSGEVEGRVLPAGQEILHLGEGTEPGTCLALGTPVLESGFGIRGAVALLCSLVGQGPSTRQGKDKWPGSLGRTFTRALAEFSSVGGVLDGVLWGMKGGTLAKGYLVRNTLLGGSDLLAVDAVAAKLAGLDPLNIPWMRYFHERGLGVADPRDMKLVGHTDLAAEPFAGRQLAGVPLPKRASLAGAREKMWRFTRRRVVIRAYGESPWGRLEDRVQEGQLQEEGT